MKKFDQHIRNSENNLSVEGFHNTTSNPLLKLQAKKQSFEKITKSLEFSISGKNIKSKNFLRFQNYSTIDLGKNEKTDKFKKSRKTLNLKNLQNLPLKIPSVQAS